MNSRESVPEPLALRQEARRFLELAKTESDPHLKRGLAACAYAMSQLAECIERKNAAE